MEEKRVRREERCIKQMEGRKEGWEELKMDEWMYGWKNGIGSWTEGCIKGDVNGKK